MFSHSQITKFHMYISAWRNPHRNMNIHDRCKRYRLYFPLLEVLSVLYLLPYSLWTATHHSHSRFRWLLRYSRTRNNNKTNKIPSKTIKNSNLLIFLNSMLVYSVSSNTLSMGYWRNLKNSRIGQICII